MSTTVLVKKGGHYYKVRLNPHPAEQLLRKTIARQMKRGRLASVVRLELRLRRLKKKNPLIKSSDKKSIGKNIAFLLAHPEELTAKTPEMKRKQACAIAYSVWRKALYASLGLKIVSSKRHR